MRTVIFASCVAVYAALDATHGLLGLTLDVFCTRPGTKMLGVAAAVGLLCVSVVVAAKGDSK